MRTTLKVIKRCLKPCSNILFIWENRLIRLTPLHRHPYVSKFRDIRKGRFYEISCRTSYEMSDILQETLQSHPCLSHESLKRRVTNRMGSNGLNLFSRISVILELGLGHVFTTSSNSRFFNKTDLERYPFNIIKILYHTSCLLITNWDRKQTQDIRGITFCFVFMFLIFCP